MKTPALGGPAYGLLAAMLFGASAPLAKMLLAEAPPLMLAALFYLGAGAGLAGWRLVGLVMGRASREARLRGHDIGLMAAIVVSGGLIGPVLMLLGLEHLSATAGALMLNLEAPLTILLAVTFFGDYLGRAGFIGAGLVLLGAPILGYQTGGLAGNFVGVAAIAGACLSWALDNNLTQLLSSRDPVAVAWIKSLAAGGLTLTLALAAGERIPATSITLAAIAVGAVSYGASLVCAILAMREMGAAREAAYFATAPFVGALMAMALFVTAPSGAQAAAALLMVAGITLLLAQRHIHEHAHPALEHDHLHLHDEHHRHQHVGPVVVPHSHPHRHEPLVHSHPHLPDIHHRHGHPHEQAGQESALHPGMAARLPQRR